MGLEYKDYLEQAKEYITKNSPAFEAFEEYYKKAISNLGKEYDTSAQKVERKYFADTNKAAAQSSLNAKNIAQFMASRGLSRSGEAEQETINSNLALSQQLSELANAKYDALSRLYAEKDKALLDLEKEYATQKGKNQNWLYQTAFDLAAAEYEAAKRQEDIAREDAKIKSQREYEEYIRALEREYEKKLLEEKRAYEDKVRQEEQAFKKELAQLGSKGGSGGSQDDSGGKYVPTQNAATVAKNIISSYTDDGKKVKSISDRVRLYQYVTEIQNAGVDSSYLQDVLFALKAAGYTTPSQTEINAYATVDKSKSVYDNRWKSYYDMYIKLGLKEKDARIRADKAALNSRLDYCYNQSRSYDEFAACVEILGITGDVLDEYLKRVNVINSDAKLNKIGFTVAP
ncbi:MAG: hypothetical protein ACOX3X_09840 [Eubacteriales bacterium]|jgi:hypothetical protein